MSSDEANKLMERKTKLDDELQGKLSTELSEMIKKSNALLGTAIQTRIRFDGKGAQIRKHHERNDS